MVSVILLAAFVCMVIYYAYEYATHRPKNFPPGPPRIPFFGAYLFFLLVNFKSTHSAALLFSKWYKSKMLGFYLGSYPTVVVHSHEGVKEVLLRPEFDGRPDLFAGRLREPNFNRKGIFFNDGPIWKVQRRFILRYLRDFGFGRRFDELEIFVNEELMELVDIMKNGPEYPHEHRFFRKNQALCPYFMSPVMVNAFLKIFCNEKIPRADQEAVGDLAMATEEFQRIADDYGRLVSLFPWIRHFFPKTSGFKDLARSNAVIYKFVKNIIVRHEKTFEPDHIRNFVDMYLEELQREEGKVDTTFAIDQFIMGIVDFIFPAISAISTQLSFLFQWFLRKPEILKKIQAEIDEVVGNGRLPTLDDRQHLHYTEASLRECLRLETLVPSNLPHRAIADTELLGYSIPADTIVYTGLYGFHNDKDTWGDPEEFRPERFLDYRGHFSNKKDISLPFGAGKRLCAGETFARNMLFLTAGAICQNFNIIRGKGESLPDPKETICGLIRTPPDYWVHYEIRENH
ncbi:unnamed protein product [Hermetia illucens]|uniref:Cytochrome P450 n=1 Tax=Hermetia illucens TaxID=343691 RepID=A0A7R8Z0H1_HERIL|nr:probable cytochrome P450 304a1 [Hermetia illucens]CAD7091023.1 unnamed protein product [Hermetia illucens]